ncbi:hypothetical protein BFS86_20010 [Shewanella algae]|nr:hypothetical protein BFS86_20010 [Shewanella algae]
MADFPTEYSKQAYINWHNEYVEPEKNLEKELNALMDTLKETSRARLAKLADLFSRIHAFHLLAKKAQNEDVSDSETDIKLIDAVKTENYDNLFKSVDSILDKLWRKNKGREAGSYVTIDSIKSEIGDLVRSSIVTSTFSYATHYANSVRIWRELIGELQISVVDYSDIEEIITQEEAKIDKGYFAYHLEIRYSDGLRVEMQIYSKLSEIWRHLSHKLYEKVRLGEEVTWGHGAAASRLVSLGHLLHLAECEVQHLKGSM